MDDGTLLRRAHAGLRAHARLLAEHGAIREDGEPVAVMFVVDVGDDASVEWVATLSHARGRGLATRLLRAALKAAQQRARTSTTLRASAMGARVYERLGYRTLGHLHLWEKRP